MFKKVKVKAPQVRVVLTARAWKRMPMKLLRWGRKMPSTKEYNLVTNDEYDTRIPLHPDEAFQYGITFKAKYIGTMDVPRPSSRVEIVAAMRRVRYEFKAKGVKKRKVTVDVSTDGVRVTCRKKKNTSKKASKLFGRRKTTVYECTEIMNHPIYRIFYVSHDSSDLKIFSYIARDGATNVFKCNVFKSNRKSQAMKIVRTVGQAFEVCHKMQVSAPDQPVPSTSSACDPPLTDRASDAPPAKEGASDCAASESGAASTSKVAEGKGAVGGAVVQLEEPARPKHLELLPPPPRKEGKRSPMRTTPAPPMNLPELPECVTKVELGSIESDATTPLSAQHQLQLLRERLEQQAQQTRAAVAQLLLLRDQLAAEQAARCEAQARTHQLLVHNKELLEHIAALVAHLQERERGSSRPISAQQLTLLPQMKVNGVASEGVNANFATFNGNKPQHADLLIDLITHNNVSQNMENNNIRLSPFNMSPILPGSPVNGPTEATSAVSTPVFSDMTNEQIQNFLISKFQDMGGFPDSASEQNANNAGKHQQCYQNRNAFPGIPLLANHCSDTDLASIMNYPVYKEMGGSTEEIAVLAQPMSVTQSENSICSNSHESTSKDSSPDEGSSSDDGVPFIMPLSHNGTLTATGEDGRVRLIVPVSPSGSSSTVPETRPEPQAPAGSTLKVPGTDRETTSGPITRSTSEKVPNRSEMMTALRSQWTRHTTK